MPAAQPALNAPVRASGIIWRIFPDEPAAFPKSCTPVPLSAFELGALVANIMELFRSLEKPSLAPVSFFVRR